MWQGEWSISVQEQSGSGEEDWHSQPTDICLSLRDRLGLDIGNRHFKMGYCHCSRAAEWERTSFKGIGAVTTCQRFHFHTCDETIAYPRHRLDQLRRISRVSQRITQAVDRTVEAVVKVYEDVFGPEGLLKRLAGDYFAGVFDQEAQHIDGLPIEPDLYAALREFSRFEVQLKGFEPDVMVSLCPGFHSAIPLAQQSHSA